MLRALDKWLPGYLASVWRRPRPSPDPRHVLFCLCDHFEPLRGGRDPVAARREVADWCARYAEHFDGVRDADGRMPRHTFFFPADEYDPGCVAALAPAGAGGWGEVEIHLHHRHDTPAGLLDKLATFRDRLHRDHGWLGRDAVGVPRFGFIHGNWSLCNSRPDGDWCGVNGELAVLAAAGCYADFTFPSAPSPTQARMVNAVYRAQDAPGGAPRGADRGRRLGAGVTSAGDGLMIVQGPLAPDWRRRKWGVLPRLENAEISGVNPATPARARLWIAQGVTVAGRPDWVVVKLHTHGCVPANREGLLSARMRQFHDALTDTRTTCAPGARVHYVSARELYNILRAAEDGHGGDPATWRDYEIKPPVAMPGAA